MSQTVETDPISLCLGCIDEEHLLRHKGRMWVSGSTIIAVAIAGVTNFIIRIPATGAGGYETHIRYMVQSSGETNVDVYENPTVTVAGNARAPLNADRDSAAATAITCFSESTIGANGTYLESHIIGSAGGRVGGVARGLEEWIGDVDEDDLLVVTTRANNLDITVTWRFYEEL